MNNLVLSIFPGIDLLGRAFEEEGYCVVRGPDLLWGGDIKNFHPPAGVFDGVIGGPPCQHWAQSHNLSGDKAEQPNLIPEFQRVVLEAQPEWFLMENVTGAPFPTVASYSVQSSVLEARDYGAHQLRRRRFSFGTKLSVLFMWPPRGERGDYHHTLTSACTAQRRRDGMRANGGKPFTWQQYLDGFGLPEDFDLAPFRKDAKFVALGNSVPMPMGRAVAQAVKRAMEVRE